MIMMLISNANPFFFFNENFAHKKAILTTKINSSKNAFISHSQSISGPSCTKMRNKMNRSLEFYSAKNCPFVVQT